MRMSRREEKKKKMMREHGSVREYTRLRIKKENISKRAPLFQSH